MAAIVIALVLVLGAWLLFKPARIPTVTEIRADQLTYDQLEQLLRRHSRIRNPAGYAAFLYRRAYGKNPSRAA